jgi:hypothetical protein
MAIPGFSAEASLPTTSEGTGQRLAGYRVRLGESQRPGNPSNRHRRRCVPR